MTEETKQAEVVSTNTGAIEPQLSTEQPKDSKKIAVDVAPGVSIELDIETAKKVISHRDSKTKGYKELEQKLKSAEEARAAESSRAQLLESMKKNSVEEVEALVSSKYIDKLKKVETKIVNSALENALLAREDFIKESKEDAIKLLKSTYEFAADENFEKVVTKDGKDINEIVNSWLDTKDIFRKSKGVTPTGAKTNSKVTSPNKQQKNPYETLGKGLESLFNKK